MKTASTLTEPFQSLRNPLFARLYLAQTISLFGDAVTWVGLPLLAFQFGPDRSAVILSTALTLRVAAFIIFSPYAGVLADRTNRKKVLYFTHFCRMAIVGCLPFVDAEWQIYVLVFLLNVFNAFFTPTYRAIIAQVLQAGYYRDGIALSSATDQLLSVLGPGIAGVLAIWMGVRDIFVVDAVTFVVAALIIVLLPGRELSTPSGKTETAGANTFTQIASGTTMLFSKPNLRFSLSIEFISAIAGAMILVNTVAHVKSDLKLADQSFGWAMSAFGLGATLSAFLSTAIDRSKNKRKSLISGILLLSLAISAANFVEFPVFVALWLFAGLGQSMAEMPSEILIGESIPLDHQGRVYGAHFAWSHLWWAIAYPVAGWVGTRYAGYDFLIGALLSLVLLIAFVVTIQRQQLTDL